MRRVFSRASHRLRLQQKSQLVLLSVPHQLTSPVGFPARLHLPHQVGSLLLLDRRHLLFPVLRRAVSRASHQVRLQLMSQIVLLSVPHQVTSPVVLPVRPQLPHLIWRSLLLHHHYLLSPAMYQALSRTRYQAILQLKNRKAPLVSQVSRKLEFPVRFRLPHLLKRLFRRCPRCLLLQAQ